MKLARPVLLLLASLLLGVPCRAQQAPPRAAPVVVPAARPQLRPGTAFLASALLPGSAQYLAGDERWVPYVAAELYGWAGYIDSRRRASHFAQRYRDLAWQVARRVSVGPRRDSVFEYYEAMADSAVRASGAFDRDKQTPGVQPELEVGTFNGNLWELARGLFFPGGQDFLPGSAAYTAALDYYVGRAIPEQYAWAWGSASLEQQTFANLIRESDAASRSAARYIGLIVANHIVTAVDALVTARLRELSGGALRIEGGVIRVGSELRMVQGVRIQF